MTKFEYNLREYFENIVCCIVSLPFEGWRSETLCSWNCKILGIRVI
jgi:hypothetical protein